MLQSPHKFVLAPFNAEQYINTKKVGDVDLIVTTSIEDAKDVQREATILALPMSYKGDLAIGDNCIVHHNIFRITYSDFGGVPAQSNFYLKENVFYASPDLIYMKISNGVHEAIDDNVFVKPIKEINEWVGEKEKDHTGIIRYSNKKLREIGINDGDTIVFRKNTEYEFNILGEKLYKMSNNRILAKLN